MNQQVPDKDLSFTDSSYISIQDAQKHHAHDIARLMLLSSGGVIEFLIEDFAQETTPFETLRFIVEQENNEYSYKYTSVAIMNKKVVGIMHAFAIEANPQATKRLSISKEESVKRSV